MDWFSLQPQSIPALAQFIMAVAILWYLIRIKDKSKPTRILIAMFVGFAGFMFFEFLDVSVSAPWHHYLRPLANVFGISAFLPMAMFAYTFLGNPFEKESRIVVPVVAIVIGLLVLNTIAFTLGLEEGAFFHLASTGGLIMITLVAILTVSVFIRKSVALRSNDDVSRYAAKAHAHFAIAFVFIPLTVVPAVFREFGFLGPGLSAGLSTLFFLLFFFAFVVVFVNHAPEPTTVQVKLVGISFVTVLVVLSLAGPIANPRIVLEREAEWIVSTQPELDPDLVYRSHAHNKTIGSFWVVIVASGVVLVLFPVFFRSTLLTRLEKLLGGVRRVNDGDLEVKVPAPIGDEIGFLTSSFNDMAASLRRQISEITQLTKQAADAELERKLLQAENDRKTRELEEARKLQLSMLPQEMPDCSNIEIAATMETATEVGGDYYDFVCGPDGALTAIIGDATGHGMNAGTVVAATKGLYHAMSEEEDLTEILRRLSLALKKMNLPGLYMALGIARITDGQVELVGSGLPSAYVFRADDGSVEEYPLKGAPLGSFLNFPYQVTRFEISKGDAIVLVTDGFPELFSPDREMLGYERAGELVARYGSRSAEGILDAFRADAERWAAGNRPDDDVTVVALKVRS